jgi:DNA-binding CsgD family transcriptional regulator/N-acetylneuraminic acid mutarotase
MSITGNDLSEREQEILRLAATGAGNKEIAQQLCISTNTVKVHLRNIFAKIGVSSRTEAVMYAVNRGLVSGVGKVVEGIDPAVQSSPEAASLTQAPYLAGDIPKRSSNPLWIPLITVVAVIALIVVVIAQNLNRSATASIAPTTSSQASPWKELTVLPAARYGLALVAYGDSLYALGGRDSQGVTGRLDIYDPYQDIWHAGASKPTPVQDIGAVVVSGKIFVPGGLTASGSVTNTMEIYNPNTNMWVIGASLPVSLSAYGLTVFEGRIYLFGGWDGKTFRSEVYRYDSESNVWQKISQMQTPRAYLGAAVSGRKIILVGGKNQNGVLDITEIFSPDLVNEPGGPWKTGAPMPLPVYGMGITSMADVIYILGGASEAGKAIPALVYSPQSNEWQTLPVDKGEFGMYLGMSELGQYLFVVGGKIDTQPINRNLRYQAFYTLSLPIISK